MAAAREERDDLALARHVHSAICNLSFSRFQSGEHALVIHLQNRFHCWPRRAPGAFDEAGRETKSRLHSGDVWRSVLFCSLYSVEDGQFRSKPIALGEVLHLCPFHFTQ